MFKPGAGLKVVGGLQFLVALRIFGLEVLDQIAKAGDDGSLEPSPCAVEP